MSNFSLAIVGLPNVGKSTLFNALTKKNISSENYPFCTIEPNIAIVAIKDQKLDKLAKLDESEKIIYATTTFVDVAGLVKGAAKGEGLGNKFLTNIKETDAILHVVRCFEDEKIVHVEGKIDPVRDIETVNLELILKDLEQAENMLEKLTKKYKSQKEKSIQIPFLEKVISHLNKNLSLRTMKISEEEKNFLKTCNFLTFKKVLYVANVSEKDLLKENKYVKQVKEFALKETSEIFVICAKLEEEIAQFNEEEAKELLKSLNLQESGLNRLIKKAFSLLDLIFFITSGKKETKAWVIKKGETAKMAAGKIHSDIEKGFIKAEIVSYNDMIKYNGRAGAKTNGVARLEGKDYIVQSDDVILFYHN